MLAVYIFTICAFASIIIGLICATIKSCNDNKYEYLDSLPETHCEHDMQQEREMKYNSSKKGDFDIILYKCTKCGKFEQIEI